MRAGGRARLNSSESRATGTGMRNPWALEYARNPDRFIWGTAPSRLAQDLVALMPPRARVLDLGCGEGRDSVYFASRGYDVTGVDVSAAGLEKAERLASELGVSVRWLCRSMLDLPVAGRFDLVYSCGSIHHVPRDDRPQLFRRLRTLSRRGGLHAHIVFTDVIKYAEKTKKSTTSPRASSVMTTPPGLPSAMRKG